MSTSLETINYQAGVLTHICHEKIEQLTLRAVENTVSTSRLKSAFSAIAKSFFQDPTNFKFAKTVEVGLQGAGLKEDVEELLEILKGTSETFPLPICKLDGEGRSYEAISLEDQETIKATLCTNVAIKINSTVQELSSKRKALEQESRSIQEGHAAMNSQRAELEAKIAAARIKQNLRLTQEGCIQLVTQDGMELEKLEPFFQDNREIVLAAVKQNGKALQFASPRLKNDREIVSEAIRNTEHALEFAGNDFKDNRESVLALIRENELAIGFGNDVLVEDRAFILDAVKANGLVLQLLDETLRNDREIILAAIKQNDEALEFVGAEQRAFAEAFVSVTHYEMALPNLPAFQNDKVIVLEAVARDYRSLAYASNGLRNDRDIVLTTVTENGLGLQYASDELKNDKDIVLEAIKQNPRALQYASRELKNDRAFISGIIRILSFQREQLQRDLTKS